MKNSIRILLIVAFGNIFHASLVFAKNKNYNKELDETLYPRDPILRINTQMHLAPIVAAFEDKKNKRYITVSKDKTIKFWSVDDGELLYTLRIPIGNDIKDNIGDIQAAAMDPKGQWLAVTAGGIFETGVMTGITYIVSLHNYKIMHYIVHDRKQGIPFALCTSFDGKYLSGTYAAGTLRWRTSAWENAPDNFINKDLMHSYRSDGVPDSTTRSCTYTRNGQFLYPSYDYLRLYQQDKKNPETIPVYGEIRSESGEIDDFRILEENLDFPYKIVIHPDNNNFYLSYLENKDNIPLISHGTLIPFKLREAVNTDSLGNGSLPEVAWSLDGKYLYAGGNNYYYEKLKDYYIFPVWRWQDIQYTPRKTLEENDSPITSLNPLSDGELLITTSRPAWYLQNEQGITTKHITASNIDMREKIGDAFQVSEDGKRIYLGREIGDKNPIIIDLGSRSIHTVTNAPEGVRPAYIDLPITDWHSPDWDPKYSFKLNGKEEFTLGLGQIYSFAVNKENNKFAFGTKLSGIIFGELTRFESIPSEVLFQTGKADLSAAGKETIKDTVNEMLGNTVLHSKDSKAQITIIGHTDSQGDEAYNQELSEKRAASVADYLIEYGIPEDILTITGYGENSPIADNNTAEGRAQNRRVEFAMTGDIKPELADSWEDFGSLSPEAVPYGLNFAMNGQVLLAALGDGTVRWYHTEDREELLALFVDKDTLEWIAWTPEGYYDASANGDKLIGWHVNRGVDQTPDFFSADKFRSRFYRPLFIHYLLDTHDFVKAKALAEQDGEYFDNTQGVTDNLPPALDILNIADYSVLPNGPLTLELDIRSDSSDLQYIRILADGNSVVEQAISGRSGRYAVTTDIPLGTRQISVFAVNNNGSSPVVSRNFRLTEENIPLANAEDVLKPTLYVLAIGVSTYQDASLNLIYADKDAIDFANFMETQKGLYRDVQVKLLTSPNRDDMLAGLDWLLKEVTDRDIAMFFYAGHGTRDDLGSYQLLASDSNLDKLHRTAVPADEIEKILGRLPGKRFAFLDACYSGDILSKGKRGLGPMIDIDDIANELAKVQNGVIVFSSSTGNQFSLEDRAWGNGAFTKALLEGLQGKADYLKQGTITHQFLGAYIAERVKTLTDNKQTPTMVIPDSMPDFPISIVK